MKFGIFLDFVGDKGKFTLSLHSLDPSIIQMKTFLDNSAD